MSEETTKGRPADFNVQTLIDDLLGTCKTIDEFLPEGMSEEDLTEDDRSTLDDQIFLCETCGWWCERSEESDEENKEGNCRDCAEDIS